MFYGLLMMLFSVVTHGQINTKFSALKKFKSVLG